MNATSIFRIPGFIVTTSRKSCDVRFLDRKIGKNKAPVRYRVTGLHYISQKFTKKYVIQWVLWYNNLPYETKNYNT